MANICLVENLRGGADEVRKTFLHSKLATAEASGKPLEFDDLLDPIQIDIDPKERSGEDKEAKKEKKNGAGDNDLAM